MTHTPLSNIFHLFHMKRYCYGLWLALLLTGCAQLSRQENSCVTLAKEVQQCLLPLPWQAQPQLMPTPRQMRVNLQHAQNRHELLLYLQPQPQQFTLVGIAPLGQALFTLTYDGHTLISEQSMLLGQSFRSDYLLALMQLIYWPTTQLVTAVQGARVQDSHCGAQHCRQLINAQGEVIATVHYQQVEPWQGEVSLALPQSDVQLQLTPL